MQVQAPPLSRSPALSARVPKAGLRYRCPEDDAAGSAAALRDGADRGAKQVRVPGVAAVHPGRPTAPARPGWGGGVGVAMVTGGPAPQPEAPPECENQNVGAAPSE
ncbi:uncharacterized protein LOC144576907 isoform X2 [Callithrix jacchus]